MLAIKRSADVTPEGIKGIHCMQLMKYASGGSTLALKSRTDITRSLKQGISGPTKRTDVLQNLKENPMEK